jgi:uncharacterized coiled-coil DUF342 family protein
MTEDVPSLQEQIDHLETQLTSLEERLTTLNEYSKEWRIKRDVLNQKCKETGKEITHYKAKRDQLNQKIKELKLVRNNLKADLAKSHREYTQLEKEYSALSKTTSQSETEINRQIQSLDWQIQTSSFVSEKEASLIEEIRTLEQQRLVYRELFSLEKKIQKLHLVINTLKKSIKDISQQIINLAGQSQENHINMLGKRQKIADIKAEADNAHQTYLTYTKNRQETHSKYQTHLEQIRDLRSQIGLLKKREQKHISDKALELQRQTAYKKLEEKKKMSFDEFKTLMKKGSCLNSKNTK